MGRNAAQLRAAADATGWFNGPQLQYVGDGFTVPWEVALPVSLPFGTTMWIYKRYLDFRWPEAARLHDWLYTPYGKLINATREEADDAIREDIAVDSAIDAEIVYRSVRAGGGPYFGTSQTGVAGYPVTPSGPNMALAPEITFGGSSVATKVVIVFQMASQPTLSAPDLNYAPAERVGGWTESVLSNVSYDTLIGRLKGPRTDGYPPLLPARAGILANRGSILGVRLYEGGGGRGQFLPLAYSGSAGACDVPQMALLCAGKNDNSPTVRRWTVRGIPDGQVEFGEFSPTTAFNTAMTNYFKAMSNFGFTGTTPVTSYAIFNVSALGLVTLKVNNPFGVGDIVTLKSVMVQGVRTGGSYVVESIGPLASNFTIKAWPVFFGEGGSVSIPEKAHYNLGGGLSVQRVAQRKVGRPFNQYRGRRSKRRIKR